MREKNIVMVTLNLEVGGLERVVVDMTLALAARGHQLSVVTLRSGGVLAAPLKAAGVPVISLNFGDGLKLGYARALGKCLDMIGPDLVHSHGEAALFYSSLVRFCGPLQKSRRFVHVHSRHGYEDVSSKGIWRNRLAHRGCDAVVCVSDDLARHCEQVERVAPDRLYTVINGVDLSPYRDLPALDYVTAAPVIGHVARLAPIKNQALLLKAFARVKAQLPAARLEIVGDGPERAALETLTQTLALSDSVTFHGETSDVPAKLARCHLFCLSSDSEGTPVSVIEALAASRPVVATDVGGLSALVGEAAGRLAPAGDADAFAVAVLQVYASQSAYESFCRGAANAPAGALDANAMIDSYLSIYAAAETPATP